MQVTTITKPTAEQVKQIRAIAKRFGIKGCRQGNFFSHVGSQFDRIENGGAVIDAFKSAGFHVDCEDMQRKLIANGIFSSFMVAAAA
jgi:hypothetical protein